MLGCDKRRGFHFHAKPFDRLGVADQRRMDDLDRHFAFHQAMLGLKHRAHAAAAQASAANYSAIAFVGGWGMSQDQYATGTTYDHGAYNGSATLRTATNNLINDFVTQEKYVAGLCYGVSVLAWARVDGASLLENRTVVGWEGIAPHVNGQMGSTRGQIEANGATMLGNASIGDPTTTQDDVIVDGNLITATDFASAAMFGQVIAERVSELTPNTSMRFSRIGRSHVAGRSDSCRKSLADSKAGSTSGAGPFLIARTDRSTLPAEQDHTWQFEFNPPVRGLPVAGD
jgi:putative intracellular protease/amidase